MIHRMERYLIPGILLFSLYAIGWYFEKYASNGWGDLKSISEWGAFGDFFGGILNPLIAFGALCLLHLAYVAQKQELKETREHFQNESKRGDIYKVIQQIDKELEILSNYSVMSSAAKSADGYDRVLGTVKELMIQDWNIQKNQYIRIANSETKGNIQDFIEKIGQHMGQLIMMLNSYTSIKGSSGHLRSHFFAKYSGLIDYLRKRQLIGQDMLV